MENYNKEAVERYKKKAGYKQLKIESKGEYIAQIKDFAKIQGISIAEFVINSCMYFINRGEIPPN